MTTENRHLLLGIYKSEDSKTTKYAEAWYNSIATVEQDYEDGSWHIPTHAEWDSLNSSHKAEVKAYLDSCGIGTEESFACSSWNTVRDMPYYRIYKSGGIMEDHTGNKGGCYCLLMKWSL